MGFTRRLPNRRDLDVWASENPVLVRPGLRGNINSKAIEVLNDILPGYSASIHETMHGDVIGEDVAALGWVGSQEMAVIQWELFMENVNNNTLAPDVEAGVRGVGLHGRDDLGHAHSLSQSDEWVCQAGGAEPDADPVKRPTTRCTGCRPIPSRPASCIAHRRTAGHGGDYMWFDGVASERWDSHVPEGCMGPDTHAPPHIKARETCPKAGDLHWDTLKNASNRVGE